MNINKINSVNINVPKRPALNIVKETYNPIGALKSVKVEDVVSIQKKVNAPQPPKMELVKEDYNPVKLIIEIFKELFAKK